MTRYCLISLLVLLGLATFVGIGCATDVPRLQVQDSSQGPSLDELSGTPVSLEEAQALRPCFRFPHETGGINGKWQPMKLPDDEYGFPLWFELRDGSQTHARFFMGEAAPTVTFNVNKDTGFKYVAYPVVVGGSIGLFLEKKTGTVLGSTLMWNRYLIMGEFSLTQALEIANSIHGF